MNLIGYGFSGLYFWLLSLLAFNGVVMSSENFNDKLLPKDVFERLEDARMIKPILETYFGDESTIKMLWLKQEYVDELKPILHHRKTIQAAYIHFDDARYLEQEKLTVLNTQQQFSSSEGYVVFSNLATLKCRIAPLFKTLNPCASLAFFIDAKESNGTFSFLRDAWEKHGLSKIIVFCIDFNNDTFFGLTVLAYNPFKLNNNNILDSFRFTLRNYITEMHRLDIYVHNKFKNLNGFPLKVFLFEQPMFSKKRGNNRYTYIDGEVADLLSRQMNFTPIYVQDPKDITYGQELSNGEFTGALAAIEYGLVDMSANMRVITTSYRTRNLLFLRYIYSADLVFVVPKSYIKRNYLVFPWEFYSSYALITYMIIFSCFVLSFYTMQKYKFANDIPESNFNVIGIILTIFAVYHSLSVKIHLTTLRKRIIFGMGFAYAVILSSIYQASIVNQLNTWGAENDIKTLEQLLATPLQLVMHEDLSVYIEHFKHFPETSLYNQLYKRSVVIPRTVDGAQLAAVNRTTAILTFDMYAMRHHIRLLDPETGDQRTVTVPGKVLELFESVTVPKNSPFIQETNERIGRIVQAGLSLHQLRVARNEMRLGYLKIAKTIHLKPRTNILTFDKLTMLYVFLVITYSVLFVVFLCELIWSRRKILLKLALEN